MSALCTRYTWTVMQYMTISQSDHLKFPDIICPVCVSCYLCGLQVKVTETVGFLPGGRFGSSEGEVE